MNLREFLDVEDGKTNLLGVTIRRLSKDCGVSCQTLYAIALGHRIPSARLACDIEHHTGGTVNRRVTLPNFPWDQPMPRAAEAA